MPPPDAQALDRRSSSIEASSAAGEAAGPSKTCPFQLRAELEEFFDRLSLFAAHDSTIVPFDVQFDLLVCDYTPTAIQQAILMTYPFFDSDDQNHQPEELDSYTGRLPIHLACDKCAPTRVIQWLIAQDENGQSIRSADKWGDLPIHTACSRRGYVTVIDMLLAADPETIVRRDLNGLLPLHMACRYNLPAEAIGLLLQPDTDGQTLHSRAMNDQLPLHIAARCDAPVDVLNVLLQADTTHTTILQTDSAGRIPLHIAFLRNAATDVVALLLHHMFVGRMERLGLDLWKRDMDQLVESMSTHERDFMTREKLNVIIEAIHEMVERIVLLELAVWREACLTVQDGHRVESMAALAEHLGDNHGSVAEYKQERRIKSGAECIARSVLSFLEGAPLAKYKKEFPESGLPFPTRPTARQTSPSAPRP